MKGLFLMQKRFTFGISLILAFLLLVGATSAWSQGPASIKKPDAAALSVTDDVLKTVSRLRGLDIKSPVKSSYKTQNEIEQSVIHDLDENTSPEEFAASSKTLTKLGLIPKGFQLRDYMVKLLREQIAGYYDPKTRELYLAAW